MFCTNCGAQIADGSKFCTNCGAQFGAPAPAAPAAAAPVAAAGTAVAVAAKKKSKLLPIIIIAAIVVIAAIVLLIVLGGGGKGGYEKVIGNYFTAVEKGDAKGFVKLLWPVEVDMYKLFLDDDDIAESMDPLYSCYKSKVKSWEITDSEAVSKKELKEMENELKQTAEMLGKKVKGISEAVEVKVKADIKGEGKVKLDISLVKTGGKWYIASIEN